MDRFSDPEGLGPAHLLDGFDCGVSSLGSWLLDHARSAAAAGSARTFVLTDNELGRVVGYHALSVASVSHENAAERVTKGMPRHEIPAVLLARLAVDSAVQGRGLGAWLLRDAMLRTVAVSEEVGIRALLVHAIDDSARAFYTRFGFEPSRTDPNNLQIIIKDIKASLEGEA